MRIIHDTETNYVVKQFFNSINIKLLTTKHIMNPKQSPYVAGLFTGMFAYLIGYAITIITVVLYDHEWMDILTLATGENTHTIAGWVFYSTHYVGLSETPFGENLNVISGTTDGLPETLLFALPVLMLVAAGYATARIVSHTNTDNEPVNLVFAGACVVLGYSLFTLIGVFTFRTQIDVLVFGPDLGYGIVLMGFIYPVVLGTIGGYIAQPRC